MEGKRVNSEFIVGEIFKLSVEILIGENGKGYILVFGRRLLSRVSIYLVIGVITDVNAKVLSSLFNGAVVVVVIVANNDFFRVAGKDANIKPDRLQFFDKNLKGFGNAGFGNVLTFNDSLISFDAPHDVIRFNGKNF